jgi:hypothetical protein
MIAGMKVKLASNRFFSKCKSKKMRLEPDTDVGGPDYKTVFAEQKNVTRIAHGT